MENRRIKWRVIKRRGKGGGVITLDFYSSRVASRKDKIEIRRNVISAPVLFLFAFSWIRWTLEVASTAAVITEYFDSASRSRLETVVEHRTLYNIISRRLWLLFRYRSPWAHRLAFFRALMLASIASPDSS